MRWLFRARQVASGIGCICWGMEAQAHGHTYSHSEVVVSATRGSSSAACDVQVRTWLQGDEAKAVLNSGRQTEHGFFVVVSKDSETSVGKPCTKVSSAGAPYSDGYEATVVIRCQENPVFLVLTPVFLSELRAPKTHTVAWVNELPSEPSPVLGRATSGAQLLRNESDALTIQVRARKPSWFALAPLLTALLIALGFAVWAKASKGTAAP
jgi:hypothetical protein